MLRQLAEMRQTPEVATEKVCILRLFSESRIWDSVAFEGQVKSFIGEDGEGKEVTGDAEYIWEDLF